eukprot:TRINITY_DN6329_c0_g1_i1.p1 TRINITY_DN6329_c0_g1~~TRINITY_DN6329_c0_g1_i1.p1  ORF type:complete len:231 (+),score=44.75 TRINITY_DN6329_c0_g1_i1:119-811(+)
MIRRPPRSTQGVSSAASDVYKRQVSTQSTWGEQTMIKGKKEAKKYIRAKDSSGPLFGPSSRATPGLNQAKCSHKTEGLSKINSAFVNSSKPRFSQLGPGQNLRCEISGNSALLLATPRVSNSHLLEREGSPSAEEGKALFPERRNSIEPKARALNTRMQYNKLEKMQTCADVSQILTAKGYSSGSPKKKKKKKKKKKPSSETHYQKKKNTNTKTPYITKFDHYYVQNKNT